MKKEYQKPTMCVVKIHAANQLLAGSVTQATSNVSEEFGENEELY